MKKNNLKKVLSNLLIIFFICQFLVVVFFNLTQLKYHMGYDAAINYLNAIEIAKQKTIFLSNWQCTTFFAFISNIPVASLIFSISKNIFLSFGIVNIFFLVLIIIEFRKILIIFGCKNEEIWLGLNHRRVHSPMLAS